VIPKTLILGISLAATSAAGDISLHQPVDCALGQTCHIQQYVDADPGADATDHTCGTLSYNTHKGTDFALPSLAAMQAGVNVLAAASGSILGIRDNMPDTGLTDATAGTIKGRECGNGVAIEHGDGWVTQYCHMKRGSITVRPDQIVTPGTILGEVGLSGASQFPHVHLSVRHNDRVIDPFAPNATTCGTPQSPLWHEPIAYVPAGIIAAGFSDRIPQYDSIKSGTANIPITRNSPALVMWAYVFGGQADDQVKISVSGPNDITITRTQILEKTQAQLFRASGKKAPSTGWPVGPYVGVIELWRDDVLLDQRHGEFLID
jgi:hypothetical protein